MPDALPPLQEHGRHAATKEAATLARLEDQVASQSLVIHDLSLQIEALRQENQHLTTVLDARDVREQQRIDSWDSLRHIFLQPSSSQCIILPPLAHLPTDESTEQGDGTTSDEPRPESDVPDVPAVPRGQNGSVDRAVTVTAETTGDAEPHATAATSDLSASLCSLHLIAPYLGVFTQLKTLRLSQAAADREAVEVLSAHMSPSVASLSLKRCGLRADDVQGVLALLAQERQALEELDLSGNAIGNAGASLLGAGLNPQHLPTQTLTALILSHCAIGRQGAEALCYALESNYSLSSLQLQNNQIGDGGSKAVGDMLLINTCLMSLNLSFNSISDTGIRKLAASLRSVREQRTPDGVVSSGLRVLRIAGAFAFPAPYPPLPSLILL